MTVNSLYLTRPFADALTDGRADAVAGPATTEDEDYVGRNVRALALVYVSERAAGGHLNERSAQQVRSRLMDFADHVPRNPKRVYRRHV